MAGKKDCVMDDATALKIYGWAKFVARRMMLINGRSFDEGDLTTEGFIGAFNIYPKYRKSKGTLFTFLYPRIEGAIRDKIREYLETRKDGNAYKDAETIRFSELNLSDESTVDDLLKGVPNTGQDKIEVKEELEKIFNEKLLTYEERLILIYRYGYELPQSVVGNIIGVSAVCISSREINLRQRLGLDRLPYCIMAHKRSNKRNSRYRRY